MHMVVAYMKGAAYKSEYGTCMFIYVYLYRTHPSKPLAPYFFGQICF